jgi:hypothetical protein
MEKCYNGIYQKNIDTLKPKVEFLNKITETFFKLIGHISPKIADASRNILEVYNILIDNIEK